MSTYMNRPGMRLLNAQPNRLSRLTYDDKYDSEVDVQVRIWTPDEGDEIVLARIWLDGIAHHKAWKRLESMPTLAETFERREGHSFQQLEQLLTLRGNVG